MKTTKLILAIAAAALLLAGCKEDNSGEEAGKATGVKLDKTELTLAIGDSETLKATVTPDDAVNKKVTWSSDDEAVAKVNKNGKVTAVADGEATITVTTDDGGHTATCEVTVAKPVAVSGVELNKTELTLTIGISETLTATVKPENAVNKKVTWSSDDEAVATVDARTGKVTAVAEGEAVITVTTEDGGHTAECAVTVTPLADILPYITDPNFKAYMQYCMANIQDYGYITLPAWDTDEDGELSPAEAATVTYINIEGGYPDGDHKIASLDGIEFFTGLAYLNCCDNQLTELDISNNIVLREFNCGYNQLTELELTNNTRLADIRCYTNQLTTLDVSGCPELLAFYCQDNQLTELDLSNNISLHILSCRDNQLTELELSNNTALQYLFCHNNRLSTLDASNMAFWSDGIGYSLYCGRQTADGETPRTLSLTLREDQKPYWESDLKGDSDNSGVEVEIIEE